MDSCFLVLTGLCGVRLFVVLQMRAEMRSILAREFRCGCCGRVLNVGLVSGFLLEIEKNVIYLVYSPGSSKYELRANSADSIFIVI